VIQHNNEILLKRIAFQLMTPSENSLQVATRRQALVSGEMLRGNKEKNRGRFETKHNMVIITFIFNGFSRTCRGLRIDRRITIAPNGSKIKCSTSTTL
jgi:hypothetical protein